MLDQKRTLPEVPVDIIKGKVAYIKIPGFSGNDKLAKDFAKLIQNKIKSIDKSEIDSWIIDLSENTGGSMYPMILGLEPVLGDKILGYFVDVDNKFYDWKLSNGAIYIDGNYIMGIDNPYKLKNQIDKIAVIISRKTSSSGEALAITFKGGNNTRFFGENTYGVSTGNAEHKLSDGAMIVLTVCKFADRNKAVYGIPIKPDVKGIKRAKDNAIEWIDKE